MVSETFMIFHQPKVDTRTKYVWFFVEVKIFISEFKMRLLICHIFYICTIFLTCSILH